MSDDQSPAAGHGSASADSERADRSGDPGTAAPVAKFSAPRPPAKVRERERARQPKALDQLDDTTALVDAVFRAEQPPPEAAKQTSQSVPERSQNRGVTRGDRDSGRSSSPQGYPQDGKSYPQTQPSYPQVVSHPVDNSADNSGMPAQSGHTTPPPSDPTASTSVNNGVSDRRAGSGADANWAPTPPHPVDNSASASGGYPQDGHFSPGHIVNYPQANRGLPPDVEERLRAVTDNQVNAQPRPPHVSQTEASAVPPPAADPSSDLVPVEQTDDATKSQRKRKDKEKQPKPRRATRPIERDSERPPNRELSLTEISGHVVFTPQTVTAWYVIPGVRWSFRPDLEREALITAIAEQYASLAGMRLHLRRTTRPFPAADWARTVDENTPTPLPGVPGGTSWGDHLVAAQQHLHSLSHSEGETYLGITFARRSLFEQWGDKLSRMFGRSSTLGERERVEKRCQQFDEILGSFGVRARRASTQQIEWLIYRSVALGMEPPAHLSGLGSDWEIGDTLALTEQIERYRSPYGSSVKLVNRLTGEETHTAIVTVGRMEELEIPQRHEPWLHFHERCPWPLEISSRVDILGAGEAFKDLDHRLRLIRSQQHDYDEHALDAPPELQRLAERALVVGDEMTTGLPIEAARAHGWHRIAVSAPTKEECLERARTLIQTYQRDMRISVQHPKNQDWLAREFIPGEPLASTGYVRRMPVKLFAAGLPQAGSAIGDHRGDLIGNTSGTSRRPVFLDLHFATEVREKSGLSVFVAEPGGGKSTMMGALGYLAARRGVQVTLLDPSGPLAELCEMPEMKPYSRVLNLTGSEYGTLAPYALIPSPNRDHYPDTAEGDREYEIAVSGARSERRMLVQDICSMLLPPQVAREASTARLLRHAARYVPAEEDSALEDIVECLQDAEGERRDDGAELAALLLDTAEMPLAKLFFGNPAEGALDDDTALTVITMSGLRLPDLGIEREYWSAEEALALPMLHTAHRLAVRRAYGTDINRRKLVGLDEAHFMEGWRSGRSFLVRLARDSRKWNLSALVASQNPNDILSLDVQNLVSNVFVGRIAEDAEVAADALRMLRVPTGVGYEDVLASLSSIDADKSSRLPYREFLMRDVDGRVQRIRADFSWVRGLLDYLDTTPGSRNQKNGKGRDDGPQRAADGRVRSDAAAREREEQTQGGDSPNPDSTPGYDGTNVLEELEKEADAELDAELRRRDRADLRRSSDREGSESESEDSDGAIEDSSEVRREPPSQKSDGATVDRSIEMGLPPRTKQNSMRPTRSPENTSFNPKKGETGHNSNPSSGGNRA